MQGRNAEEQVKMIQQVMMYNSKVPQEQRITVSVEIEKIREPLYQLFPHGDVVRLAKLYNVYVYTVYIYTAHIHHICICCLHLY